ncbi:MGMT family protein [Agrobacterium pusense]|uniref:MGMT family protein n=1 Tax=Agrobacterium pusense TaxID=648995 RepID=UPI003B52AED6
MRPFTCFAPSLTKVSSVFIRVVSSLPFKPKDAVSDEELARRVESGKRGKSVASACASNPLAVAIPCHRVRRSDGSAFRYTWGSIANASF